MARLVKSVRQLLGGAARRVRRGGPCRQGVFQDGAARRG